MWHHILTEFVSKQVRRDRKRSKKTLGITTGRDRERKEVWWQEWYENQDKISVPHLSFPCHVHCGISHAACKPKISALILCLPFLTFLGVSNNFHYMTIEIRHTFISHSSLALIQSRQSSVVQYTQIYIMRNVIWVTLFPCAFKMHNLTWLVQWYTKIQVLWHIIFSRMHPCIFYISLEIKWEHLLHLNWLAVVPHFLILLPKKWPTWRKQRTFSLRIPLFCIFCTAGEFEAKFGSAPWALVYVHDKSVPKWEPLWN